MVELVIGEVKNISRYPIKSMAGEDLKTIRIDAYGLYGDRSHAFIDAAKEGWERYITARQLPHLLGYKVRLGEDISLDEFPQVEVLTPDGRLVTWDETLLDEIQSHFEQKIAMIRCKPDSTDLLAVDTGGILIVTDHSLHQLEHLVGNSIDIRRFRPNLVISLNSQHISNDSDLIGKRLRIGNTELQLIEECERCSIITIDPDTYERDSSILKKVNEEMNLNFGVYASVIKVGEVNVGDKVYFVSNGVEAESRK